MDCVLLLVFLCREHLLTVLWRDFNGGAREGLAWHGGDGARDAREAETHEGRA